MVSGHVNCWGGEDTAPDMRTPVLYEALSATLQSTCGLTTDGAIQC